MLPAPIPTDEPQRLAELRALRILDTPRETRFDLIVQLARQVFQVPMAYIALVDAERQWFKSKCGVDAVQTPRDISFCGHAILEDRLMIVADALEDIRFRDNPMVIGEPRVRFYAGHPLPGPNGFHVGTLCVADSRPRTLTADQQSQFQTLAQMAAEQLQLMNTVATQRDLLDTQTQLLQTQQRLQGELAEAADYVRSLLPPPVDAGPVQTDWVYQSSSQLGGDLFGYHWLDDTRLAIYLFDVCGHGVGASLLASSVQTALRRQTLPDCDFTDPGQVLVALDDAFPMDKHHDKFFTIWYGVYDRESRELKSAAAGHHPATLFPGSNSSPEDVGSRSLMIGVMNDRLPQFDTRTLPPGSRLYLYSDGAFELRNADGQMLGLAGLRVILREVDGVLPSRVARIQQRLADWTAGEPFPDDFSLVEFRFP